MEEAWKRVRLELAALAGAGGQWIANQRGTVDAINGPFGGAFCAASIFSICGVGADGIMNIRLCSFFVALPSVLLLSEASRGRQRSTRVGLLVRVGSRRQKSAGEALRAVAGSAVVRLRRPARS